MVVAAYGLILPQVVLDTPKYGCFEHIPRLTVATLARCSAYSTRNFYSRILKLGHPYENGRRFGYGRYDVKTYCLIEATDTSAKFRDDKLAHQGAEATVKVLASESALQHYLTDRRSAR